MKCRLGDRILLAMTAEAFLKRRSALGHTVASGAAPFIAVFGAPGRPIVSCGNNPFVLDDDRSDLSLDAIAAHGNDLRDAHKVLVP